MSEIPESRTRPDALEVAFRKIFIGGLSYSTDEEKLKKYFGQYGSVSDAVVMKDPVSKRSRGFGFITFADVKSVDNALSHEPHTIDSRKVEAKRSVPRSEISRDTNSSAQKQQINGTSSSPAPSPNRPPSYSNQMNGTNGSYSSRSGAHNNHNSNNNSNSDSRFTGEPKINMEEFAYNKIFVGGLHYETRDAEFRSYFEHYGKVITAEVMFNRETHKSRGFGFIVFEQEEGAVKVCAEKEHIINGKVVEVKRAIPRSKLPAGASVASLSSYSEGDDNLTSTSTSSSVNNSTNNNSVTTNGNNNTNSFSNNTVPTTTYKSASSGNTATFAGVASRAMASSTSNTNGRGSYGIGNNNSSSGSNTPSNNNGNSSSAINNSSTSNNNVAATTPVVNAAAKSFVSNTTATSSSFGSGVGTVPINAARSVVTATSYAAALKLGTSSNTTATAPSATATTLATLTSVEGQQPPPLRQSSNSSSMLSQLRNAAASSSSATSSGATATSQSILGNSGMNLQSLIYGNNSTISSIDLNRPYRSNSEPIVKFEGSSALNGEILPFTSKLLSRNIGGATSTTTGPGPINRQGSTSSTASRSNSLVPSVEFSTNNSNNTISAAALLLGGVNASLSGTASSSSNSMDIGASSLQHQRSSQPRSMSMSEALTMPFGGLSGSSNSATASNNNNMNSTGSNNNTGTLGSLPWLSTPPTHTLNSSSDHLIGSSNKNNSNNNSHSSSQDKSSIGNNNNSVESSFSTQLLPPPAAASTTTTSTTTTTAIHGSDDNSSSHHTNANNNNNSSSSSSNPIATLDAFGNPLVLGNGIDSSAGVGAMTNNGLWVPTAAQQQHMHMQMQMQQHYMGALYGGGMMFMPPPPSLSNGQQQQQQNPHQMQYMAVPQQQPSGIPSPDMWAAMISSHAAHHEQQQHTGIPPQTMHYPHYMMPAPYPYYGAPESMAAFVNAAANLPSGQQQQHMHQAMQQNAMMYYPLPHQQQMFQQQMYQQAHAVQQQQLLHEGNNGAEDGVLGSINGNSSNNISNIISGAPGLTPFAHNHHHHPLQQQQLSTPQKASENTETDELFHFNELNLNSPAFDPSAPQSWISANRR